MNKIFLTMVAVACIAGNTFAQTKSTTKNNIKLGIKAGANLSNVFDSKTDQFNADAKFGFVTGGFLSIPFAQFFAFQPEVLYSQKGFKGKGNLLGSPYEFTRTTNFIDVPLLFAIKPDHNFTLLVGPQYSYLLKQTDVFTTSATSTAQEQEFNNDNIRKNIFSVMAGVDITADKVVFGLRAAWDMQNNNGDGTSSTPRYKNAWYQATIGFVL